MQQLSGSHTRTLKALGEISTDDSKDTKGDRPVLTGRRGVVRENYTGEIKGCQVLCGGCFELSGPGCICWVGTTQ